MQSESRRASKRKYANSKKGRLQQSNWRKNTLRGYLHMKYLDIFRRCNRPQTESYSYCGAKGVKCLFGSAKEFVNWALENCEFPDIPFHVHRINNFGHYEKGNIEFLKDREHYAKHKTKNCSKRKSIT